MSAIMGDAILRLSAMWFDDDAGELDLDFGLDLGAFDSTTSPVPLIAHDDLMLPLIDDREAMLLTIAPMPAASLRMNVEALPPRRAI